MGVGVVTHAQMVVVMDVTNFPSDPLQILIGFFKISINDVP